MVEADIYMSLDHIEEFGPDLACTHGDNYMPQVEAAWGPSLALFELANRGSYSKSNMPFVHRHEDMFPYMVVHSDKLRGEVDYSSWWIQPGEQDRMALMCVYEFQDWNH